MRPYKESYSVAVLKPREASRYARWSGELTTEEQKHGAEVIRWIERFRMHANRIARLLSCVIDVQEFQVHARQSVVPNRDRRKLVNRADVIAVVDPDDLFFEYLEHEPMRQNPMLSAIIGQLKTNRETLRSVIAQLPETPILSYDDSDRLQTIERVFDVNVRDERVLPLLIKRALCA